MRVMLGQEYVTILANMVKPISIGEIVGFKYNSAGKMSSIQNSNEFL